MPKLLPDQSFYPSPTMAMQAPAETYAYVALLNPDPAGRDAVAVLDVDPESPGYGAQIARVEMPGAGDELHHFGSVLRVVDRDELRPAALEIAREIATKSTTVIRAAKESLNGIDLWDVKRSYRFEQGFTFELNLSGVSDEARDAFVDKRDADFEE